MKIRPSHAALELRQIYGWHDDQRKGRTISLISSLLTNVYNVFITRRWPTAFSCFRP